MDRTALVTGGNRGLGLETCRRLAREGLRVVLAARDEELGRAAAALLASEGLDVECEVLDVSDEASVEACARRLCDGDGGVDVLVNNAAVYPKGRILELDTGMLTETIRINVMGAFWCCRAFVPGMVDRGYGRVVNVSSGAGSLADGVPGPAAYGITKAALNALTVKLARELDGRGDLKVNAVCPGWVRTRMGGDDAPRSVEEGADSIVWLATLPAEGPTGGFFRDRKPIAW
jgi:NAD(P)-dependent dehydrogenase (short-subunit alcohol dehydrogenase family)